MSADEVLSQPPKLPEEQRQRYLAGDRMLAIVVAVVALLLFALSVMYQVLAGYRGALLGAGAFAMATLMALPVSGVFLILTIVTHRREPASRKWVAPAVLLALVASALACFLWLPRRPFFDAGVKYRVAKAGGIDQLQAWATELLAQPKEERGAEEDGTLKITAALPAVVQRLEPSYVDVFDGGPAEKYVRIAWGGGFFHWGIMVGPSSFQGPEQSDSTGVSRWREGVFIWAE